MEPIQSGVYVYCGIMRAASGSAGRGSAIEIEISCSKSKQVASRDYCLTRARRRRDAFVYDNLIYGLVAARRIPAF